MRLRSTATYSCSSARTEPSQDGGGALGTTAEVLQLTQNTNVYKGTTLVSTGGHSYLLSANFRAAGHVVVFDGNSGRLLRILTLTTATNPQPSNFLLGLDFHPTTHELLVINF